VVPSDLGRRATLILATYKRQRNADSIARAALKCDFVSRVVVSNHDPERDLDDFVRVTDPRLTLMNQDRRRWTGHRWRLARDLPGDYFIAIDDDMLLHPEQLHLLRQPEGTHGVSGARDFLAEPGVARGRAVQAIDGPVDVLHEVYAVTRAHVEGYFRLADWLREVDADLARDAERVGDDILLSRCGSRPPHIHSVGRLLRCLSFSDRTIAVHGTEGFFERRRRIADAVGYLPPPSLAEGS
jgi:hypothetical protein